MLRTFNKTLSTKRSEMIRTKSIYKAANEQDGLRVLITRFYPRGVKKEHFDVWIRDLAPSQVLLKRYKNNEIDWNDFKTGLLTELRDNVDSLEAIYTLHSQSQFQEITLLCYEKDGCPCHRHMVRDIVEDPRLLESSFEPIDTDDHESPSMQEHISYKEIYVKR